MTISAAVTSGRVAAEARMLDTFDIGVPTGGYVYDPELGEDVQEIDPLFTTAGRLRAGRGLTARESEAGGRTVVEVSRELHIPVDSPAVPTGAVAVCTAVHSTSDPTLLNVRLTLAGPAPGSQTTARRLEVEETLT